MGIKIIETIFLNAEEKVAIYRLWNSEYPAQLGYKEMVELEAYLNNLTNPHHYFAIDAADNIVGWAFTFERDGDPWFGIIVDRHCQKAGTGTMLLHQLKSNATLLYGWVADLERYTKSDGSVYHSPVAFYLKNGFGLLEGIRLETEQLSLAKICWRADV